LAQALAGAVGLLGQKTSFGDPQVALNDAIKQLQLQCAVMEGDAVIAATFQLIQMPGTSLGKATSVDMRIQGFGTVAKWTEN
jgi:hypothetical protein